MIKSKRDYTLYMEQDRVAMNKEHAQLKVIHYLGLGEQIWVFFSLLRKLEYIHNCKKGFVWKILFNLLYLFYTKLSFRLGFSIPINTLGAGVTLVHRGTVVINKEAYIGANSRIHVCTNIGAFNGGAPKIGNGVYIGPGAKIFGDIEIADGVAIGANAVVNKSFLEPNISIGGIPAKKISDHGAKNLIPIVKKTKKSNLLFILPLLNGGGAERVVINLLNHLDREKFTIHLALLEKKGRYLQELPTDINIIDLNVQKARYSFFKIIKTIKRVNPDIVFSTLGYLNLYISIFRPLFSKKTLFIGRETTIVSIANQLETYPKIFNFLYRKFYKNLDLIVTQSEFMKHDLVNHYAIPDQQIVVINNPIDINKVETMANEELVELERKKINLLAVGRLKNRTKGFDDLLDMVNALDDNYHLTILGEGPDEEKLKEQIKALNLENRVTLLGFVANPYAYMKQADLLLLTSHYEGFPNVVLEANLCGTPVLAFDAPGGVGEIIREDLNGKLVEHRDLNLFINEIKTFNFDKYDAQTMRENIYERYSVNKIIRNYEQLLLNDKG